MAEGCKVRAARVAFGLRNYPILEGCYDVTKNSSAFRGTRRSRLADLLIASTAIANELAIYTRNPSDFRALEKIVDVVAL